MKLKAFRLLVCVLLFYSFVNVKNSIPVKSEFGGGEFSKYSLPKLFVISMANDSMNHNGRPISTVKNAERDAQSLVKKLRADYVQTAKNRNSKLDSLIVNNPTVRDSMIHTKALVGKQCDLKNLIATVEDYAEKMDPNDYFVFYFGSLSIKNEKGEVEFDIPDKNNKSLNVSALTSLLNRLNANKELLVFESGKGEDLRSQLMANLFVSDYASAQLSERNRIIVGTRGNGQDASECDPNMGPLMKYLTTNDNLLNVFTDKSKFYASTYRTRSSCSPRSDYMTIQEERDIKDFLTAIKEKENIKYRSGGTLTTEKKDTTKTQTYFLGIANENFGGEYDNLNTPLNDIKAIAKALNRRYRVDNTILLENRSYKVILDTLVYIKNTIGPKDKLMIHLATHGDKNRLSGVDLIFPSSKSNSVDRIRSETFKSDINDVGVNNLLLLLDVCYAGEFTFNGDNIPAHAYVNAFQNTVMDISYSEYVKENSKQKSSLVITSSIHKAPDSGIFQKKYSPFTKKIINYLKNENNNFFASSQLYLQTKGNVTQTQYKTFYRGEEPSDFLLALKE